MAGELLGENNAQEDDFELEEGAENVGFLEEEEEGLEELDLGDLDVMHTPLDNADDLGLTETKINGLEKKYHTVQEINDEFQKQWSMLEKLKAELAKTMQKKRYESVLKIYYDEPQKLLEEHKKIIERIHAFGEKIIKDREERLRKLKLEGEK